MLPTLTNRLALVTGAGRGIGQAIATSLARHGAHVILTARTADQLNQVASQIHQAQGHATPIPADLSHESQIRSLFDHIHRTFGHLDILINNAGIGLFGPTDSFPTDHLDAILTTNIRAPFLCCREALKLMRPARQGYIINIASVVGFKGYPQQAAYTASKHAVMGLTKSLAAEVSKEGIRVSAILPGGVDTGLAGDARPDLSRQDLMHPDDIAQAVLYLLSLSDRAAVDQIYIRRRNSSPF